MDVNVVKSKLIFDNKKDCEKNRYDWNKNFHDKKLTNPKFPTFDQQIYYAGDYDDLNRFAINQAYQFHLDIPKGNPDKGDSKTRIKFSDIETAFKYIFDKFKKAVYVQIKNNKVEVYQPFSNYYFINDYFLAIPNDKKDEYIMKKMRILYNKLKEADVFWTIEDFNEYDRLRIQAMNNFKKYIDKNPHIFGRKKVNFDRTRLSANNCIFKNPMPAFEGGHSYDLYLDMLLELVKTRKIPDCHFFLNIRDFPIMAKNHTEAYNYIFGEEVKLPAEFKKVSIIPVMSYTGDKRYTDIDLPTYEDWLLHSKKYYTVTNQCEQAKNEEHLYNSKWDSKKNIAIFRGSSTGCGTNVENNIRLKSVLISKKYPDLLDSAISQWNPRPRFQNKGLELVTFSKDLVNKIGTGSFVSMAEQSNYKFILILDGHISPVRIGASMGLYSLLLIPDSNYTIWVQEYLKPWIHYVPIKSDLCDLIDKIKWCKEHDSKCKKMAEESYKLYKQHVSKDGMLSHIEKVLKEKVNTNYIKQNRYRLKNKPLIIIPFRDDANDTQEKGAMTRTQQKEYLIEYFNKIFVKSPKIVFVIQSKEGLFNRGQLLNIGFDYYYLNKTKKYTHIIFNDVDLIPDANLIKYYDIIPTVDSPILLNARGTRFSRVKFNSMYSHENKLMPNVRIEDKAVRNGRIKLFSGGVISVNAETLIESNGFPNNIYGYSTEDDIFGIRIVRNKNKIFSVPRIGSLIDIENIVNLGIKDKMKILKDKNLKFNQKWEYFLLDEKKSHLDGINSLKYEVLKEGKNEIVVKLQRLDIDYAKINKKNAEEFNKKVTIPRTWIKFKII